MTIIQKRGPHNSLTSYNPLNHLIQPDSVQDVNIINHIRELPDGIRSTPDGIRSTPDGIRNFPTNDVSDINPTLLEETKVFSRNWKLNDLLNKLQMTRDKLQTSQVVAVDDLANLLTEVHKELIIYAASSRKV